jgi:hypothetical protein
MSKLFRVFQGDGVKPLNWPMMLKDREHISRLAKAQNVTAKQWVDEVLAQFVADARQDSSFIPLKLPRPREAYSHSKPISLRVTYKISKNIHDDLSELASTLSEARGNKYTMGILATFAISRALKASGVN